MQAFPARWLLPLTLVLALPGITSIALSVPGDLEDAEATAAALAGAPMHSIVLTTGWFSPNADSSTTIGYSLILDEPGWLLVEVGRPGDPTVLQTLQNDSLAAGVKEAADLPKWYGRQGDGTIVTDGPYEFRFTFVDTAQIVTTNLRQFVVDTVSPVIEMVSVDPPVLTPTIVGSPRDVITGFTVTQSAAEDTAFVYLMQGPDTLDVGINGGFFGNGSYEAPCSDCADLLRDAIWSVEIIVFDRAGNVTTVVDSFDANFLGPDVGVQHPTSEPAYATQQPDSITGVVMDRQIIAGVTMVVRGALDSTLVLVASPGVDSTQFQVDVSQLFAAEGTYELLFPSIDEFGVSDSTQVLTYSVDRTAPPRPILSPPLSPVIRADEVLVTVLVDSTAEFLLLGGAAVPFEPQPIDGPVLGGISVPLNPGANTLTFRVVDFAGNESAAETAKVFRETTEGLSAPERFQSGNTLSVDAGGQASGVFVRIMALDGSVVRTFEDPQVATEYVFSWDLTTPEGRRVRNGAYMIMARVEYANGETRRYRKMIAVIE